MKEIRAKKIRQTFTLPEKTFQRFASIVPEGKRSALIAQLLEDETLRREKLLIEACQAANRDSALEAIEVDFQALNDPISEPFNESDW